MLHETGKPTTLAVGPMKSACSDSTVVIPNWLTAVVESLTDTAKPVCVRESLRRGGKRAGIALNPHMIRHWYATTLIENGVALPVVQSQMRHSDIAGRCVHTFRATPGRALTTSSVERTRVTSRQVSVACAGLFLPNTEEEP